MRQLRLALVLAALSVTGISFTAPVVSAQSALQEVETRLQDATASPSTNGAEPGSGYLGLVPDEKTPPPTGVRVQEVRERAPAQMAGLRADDIIIAIDDTTIGNVTDLDEVLARAAAGQRLRVTVQRAGRTESMNVTLGKRPSAAATDSQPETPSTRPPATTPESDPSGAPRTSPAPPTDPSTTIPPTTPRPITPPATRPFSSDPAARPDRIAPSDPAAPDTESLGRPSLAPPTTRPQVPEAGPPGDERLGLDVPSVDLPSVDDNPEGSTGGLPEPADGRGRASLGITVVPLTESARAAYGLGSVRRGALITAVRPDSAAEAAGLPVGGAIVRFDTRQIDTADDLVEAVRDSRAGEEVEVTFWQGDRVRRLPVRLAPVGVAAIPTLPPTAQPLPSPRPAGSGGVGSSVVRPSLGDTSERPLLSRVERAIDTLTQRPASPVYDPSEMAAVKQQITELTNQVRALEDRVRSLEATGGAPASSPAANEAPESPEPGATTPLVLPPP